MKALEKLGKIAGHALFASLVSMLTLATMFGPPVNSPVFAFAALASLGPWWLWGRA